MPPKRRANTPIDEPKEKNAKNSSRRDKLNEYKRKKTEEKSLDNKKRPPVSTLPCCILLKIYI